MSLSLLQGYSSSSEDEDNDQLPQKEISSEDETNAAVSKTSRSYKPLADPNPPSASSLPSAFDAFSEVAGPPQFLNNSVEDAAKEDVQRWSNGGRRNRKEKKDLPAGAVMESKPQLTGIRERVRSDVDNSNPQGQANGSSGTGHSGKRIVTAGNPGTEDAAELLRMCIQCGVPKTYSHGKGMVCPMCGDRPIEEMDKEGAKKKGSTIKDKEKSKRMRGQSSHATWKSETEMHLRQQFD